MSSMKDEPGASGANKACDLCYRSKLKCVGRENPPCARCVSQGVECTFDGRRKSKMTQVENRVGDVEAQLAALHAHMTVMQHQLNEMGARYASLSGSVPLTTEATPAGGARERDRDVPRDMPSATSVTSAISLPSVRDDLHHAPVGNSGYVRKRSARSDDESSDEVDEDPLVEVARGAPLGKMLRTGTRRESQAAAERGVKYIRLEGSEFGRRVQTAPAEPEREEPEDPVDAGLCTLAKARTLFDAFFKYCHNVLPIFDPETDSFEAIRRRSAFAFTAIIMVGAKFEGGASELQQKLQNHAESLAKNTLFVPIPDEFDLESVQAMLILSAWGQSAWRPGGHAMRMAMEQHLYRCLPHLVRTGMGAFKSQDELEAERPLVVGVRLWLAVCKSEYEMAFNQGRPLLINGETSVALGRRFLDHPLSMRTDSRLVAAVELLAGRQRKHLTFAGAPQVTLEQAIAEIGRDNDFIDEWYADWMAYYDRLNTAPGDFLRDLLTSGKNHNVLLTNSRLLFGVNTRADVEALIPQRREALTKAVAAASCLVKMATGTSAYKDYFLSMNSLTHVAMTFAARLLIRFATLSPEVVDLRSVGRDIESLAQILSRGPGPGAMLAEQIKHILSRARGKNLLPPRSRAPTPPRVEALAMSAVPSVGGGNGTGSGLEGSFDFLGDFQFPEDLLDGAGLSDFDAMNIFEWFQGTGGSDGAGSGSVSVSGSASVSGYDWAG